jgi:DNA-binding NarL/FixJ family response regulator
MRTFHTYLVEDHPLIHAKLAATLQELPGVRLAGWARSEDEAKAWLADPGHRPDLLIVDLFLDGGSGLGVLRLARACSPPLRCVVLSNYITPEVRQRCLALGAERVFDKSADIEALLQLCREAGAGSAPAAAQT